MDLACVPPLPVGLMSAAGRDLVSRAVQFVAATPSRPPGWPAVAVFAAVWAAWRINSMNWVGDLAFMVAVSLGSLVAAAALAVGWASEPEELERWALRAAAAAVGSALPTLIPS